MVFKDLVPVIHKKVKEMMSVDTIDKVRTINCFIRFTVPRDNTMRNVQSPYSTI
jgi:hypothetical protein